MGQVLKRRQGEKKEREKGECEEKRGGGREIRIDKDRERIEMKNETTVFSMTHAIYWRPLYIHIVYPFLPPSIFFFLPPYISLSLFLPLCFFFSLYLSLTLSPSIFLFLPISLSLFLPPSLYHSLFLSSFHSSIRLYVT